MVSINYHLLHNKTPQTYQLNQHHFIVSHDPWVSWGSAGWFLYWPGLGSQAVAVKQWLKLRLEAGCLAPWCSFMWLLSLLASGPFFMTTLFSRVAYSFWWLRSCQGFLIPGLRSPRMSFPLYRTAQSSHRHSPDLQGGDMRSISGGRSDMCIWEGVNMFEAIFGYYVSQPDVYSRKNLWQCCGGG